jgi:hypothetical protein
MRVLAISGPQLLLANHLAETAPILIYRAGNLVDTVGVNWFAGSEPFLCRTGRRMSIRIAEPNDAAAIGDLVVQPGYPMP